MLTSVTAAEGNREGTPVSLLEAQASGITALLTKHSSIPELVAKYEGGFLVAERVTIAKGQKQMANAVMAGWNYQR